VAFNQTAVIVVAPFGETIQRRAIDLNRRGVPRKRGRRNYFPAGFAGSSRPLRFK